MNQEQFQEILQMISSHSSIEIAYFISNIIIALVSIIALLQLKLFKSDQHIRVIRESITLTAIQIQRYCNDILPVIDKLYSLFESKQAKMYRGEMVRVKKDIQKIQIEFLSQLKSEEQRLVLFIINSLESLSLYFVKGIADEETAYNSIGESFIKMVERYSPVIAILRQNESTTNYSNLIKLYDLWSQKSKRSDLSTKVTELSEALNKLKPDSIKPIGIK